MDPRTAPVELREERKVVTALFADIVGSTALGERLDPEEVKLIVGDAVGRMVTEVEQLGGYVKDLAGDGLLAIFGAPVSSEDDAERAVRAGLAIVAEIERYAKEIAEGFGVEGFSVRVGVATGPTVLGPLGAGERVEYTAFGDTVNTAARLQSSAEPGTVLVDAATHREVETTFETDEPVELELKGKAERVRAVPVRRALTAASRRRELAGSELVGREGELEAADAWLERVRSGAGGVLFLTGEAGIGKTRLLLELRDRFADRPLDGAEPAWLEGRCVSYGESLPLWPFRDLLRDWLGVAADEPELRVRLLLRRRVETLFADRALEIYPYLGAMLGLSLEPDAAARLSELSPEALQYRTFEVVRELLARLADAGPVVVAIEDLHWADTTSVQLAERLVRMTEDSAVLLAVAQRDERDHASWALKEFAAREFPHLYRDLALEPLSGDAERELLEKLVGAGSLPPELEERILAHAEGNPFFLEELVRSLIDAGALVQDGDGWRFDHDVDVEIPQTVERVILARIDRLAPEAHDVLTAGSALGRRFSLALLEGVAGANGRIGEALHELQRLDLLRTGRRWPQPEYRFKHALIQETAYRTLVRETRTSLHRRAAEWLERQNAENIDEVVGLLAHHWLAADDEEKALVYLTRAGDKARLEHALDEAIGHYRALLPLLERRGERQQMALVLFKLALALHTSLRFREANAAYQQAFELWCPPAAHPSPTATLRLGREVVGNQFDPPRSYAPVDMQVQMALFDRLVERWPEATIVPSLAERWEVSDDGLSYVFRLREGLRWSDGRPLTAADVEYGIKRSLDPERPGVSVSIYYVLENAQDYALGRIDDAERIGVRALDERNVEFRLAAPAPYFLSVVNRPDGGPQPQHAVEAHGDEWIAPEHQVVSGAFREVEQTGERVVLERRTEARPRPGNLSRVEIEQLALADALDRYESGVLDLVTVQPGSPASDLLHTLHPDAHLGPPAWTVYLVFAHGHPALANVDFRRALAHAIDRERLHAAFPPSFMPGTGGIVPPALQGHTPDIAPRYDPHLARELLASSGVDEPIEVITTAGGEIERTVRVACECWQEIGVRAELRVLEMAEFIKERMRLVQYAPVAPSAWFPGFPDAEYFLRLLLHSEAADNRGRWNHPPFDELIERARRETDGRERLELFHQADRLAVAEQVATIPLAYARNVFFLKPWVRGWWEFGKSWSSFADLTVSEESPRA